MLPHVGSSYKHCLCQSDWYVLSMHFLHHSAAADDAAARIWVSNGEWVFCYWSICVVLQVRYENYVSFDCLCQRSEATLSSLTALASSPWMAALCTDPPRAHVSQTLWISFGPLTFLIQTRAASSRETSWGSFFVLLMQLSKSFLCEWNPLLRDRRCGSSPSGDMQD